MKKLILTTLLLVVTTVNAQQFGRQSLEMSVGRNLYSDKLGDSRGDILVNTGYRYMLTETFGLQGFWQFDVIRSRELPEHPECEYAAVSHNFRVEAFKRLARFGRFTVNGTAGLGVTFYYMRDDARARVFNYTAAGNVLYSLGDKRNPWGALKAEYRGIANTDQDYTLNSNFRTTSNPIQAFKQDVSLGFLVYLDTKRNKSHADWSRKRRRKLADCTECKDGGIIQPITINPTEIRTELVIPYVVILFDEGSSEIRVDQLNNVEEMAEFKRKHPELKMEMVGSSCGGKGTPERNLQLSIDRAKAVYEKLGSLLGSFEGLSYRGTGVDKKYKHENQDIQKRVNFVIYK